jgi:predicted nucleotidyltransferase
MTAPSIDIAPDELQMVQNILRRHVPDHEVWAFGSRTKGTARQYSDLDVAITTDEPLSFQVRGSMAEDFSESDLPYRVDILDWATTRDNFRRIIEQDKVIEQPKP